MPKISPEIIKSLITQENTLYVSQSIIDAVTSCTESDASAIRVEGDRLKVVYDELSKKREPIVVDYSGNVTIDAYSVYYLPRNTLVPKVAILCCAYNESLQDIPDKLRVLDIGSGTGGVVLGLIDLFNNKVFSGIQLEIIALDSSSASLARQKKLVDHINIRGSSHQCYQVDLSEPKDYKDKLSIGAPYNMVFAANVFAELSEPVADTLLEHVAPLMSENGIIVNVESQSNFAMRQRVRIARKAKSLGLHVYYPCPPDLDCTKKDCWMWRTDEFICPDIMVGSEAVETTKIQIAHWVIFSVRPYSIYEIFHAKDPELTWGVVAPYRPKVEGDKVKHGYEFCTESGGYTGTITQDIKEWALSMEKELFKRGTIIGIAKELKKIEMGWDIVSGFIDY